MARSLQRLLTVLALLAVTALASQARAQDVDIVEGRLSLTASYGFLAQFFQHSDVSSEPVWGHGVFLRLGGERCAAVCLGISVLGSIMVSPGDTGSIGVGPHIGTSWEGPSWGGPYSFRFGAAYHWLRASYPDPNDLEFGQIDLIGTQSAHGVGAWLAIDLELLPRTRFLAPVIGIRGSYVAVVTTDPVIHQLTGQVVFGLTLGRRLVFGDEELERPSGADEEEREEEEEVPDEVEEDEDERRLQDAEDELRRMPGRRF